MKIQVAENDFKWVRKEQSVVECCIECPWDRVCANHKTAGDFRTEDGCRPILSLRNGEIHCETFHSKGDGTDYHECPVNTDVTWIPLNDYTFPCNAVLYGQLVEHTDNYVI